jgi:sirohydrochlorin cobaltochelatase
MSNKTISAAPMSAAPMKYNDDGSVAWGEMWDSFCALALDGGPPHRGQLMQAPTAVDIHSPAYQFAANEIIRGITAVSGLRAETAEPRWIAVHCPEAGQAAWLSEAINKENVEARSHGATLYVPVADSFTLKGEIKSVITAVAKTTHYWHEHLPTEVKQTLAVQTRIDGLVQRVQGWFGKRS